MAKYYVNDNAQSNGDHEVHKEGCYWLGQANSVTPLGECSSCHEAVRKAKKIYPQSKGAVLSAPFFLLNPSSWFRIH